MGGKGSGKKIVKPKECKKMVKKFRVTIEMQWRDFNNQKEAREWAREILRNDAVYFMNMKSIEVEEKGC